MSSNSRDGNPDMAGQRRDLAHNWDGPDDPDNPRNFSLAMCIFSITTVTCLAMVGAFAGSIYAAGQDEARAMYGCNSEAAILPLSLYNLGLAFGPVIGAPLSETYGRKTVFVITTPIFIAFMIGGGFAETITSFCICRFFAGMFASPNINNASATILDLTTDRYRGVIIGIYYSIPSFGATFGPLVGGFIVQSMGWRWTQWISIFVAAGTYIPVFFTKETYKAVILQRRAIQSGLLDASSFNRSPMKAARHFFTTLITRPIHMLLTEPIVTFISLYNGLLFGLLYAFVISVPWMMERYYDFNKTGQSLSYLGMIIGILGACIPFGIMDLNYYQKRLSWWRETHDRNERFPPEYRLLSAMIGTFLIPASLFIVAWTVQFRVHWIVPILFQGIAMMSCLLVYAGVNLFMLDSYGPLYGASASGAMMLSRYTLSFAFPLFTLKMFESLGAGWATSLLGFLTLLMTPIPWCFWRYGVWLRKNSKYEISD